LPNIEVSDVGNSHNDSDVFAWNQCGVNDAGRIYVKSGLRVRWSQSNG